MIDSPSRCAFPRARVFFQGAATVSDYLAGLGNASQFVFLFSLADSLPGLKKGRSIYNIQISSRKRKKSRCGRTEKISI